MHTQHTQRFYCSSGICPGLPRLSRYQKGKTTKGKNNVDLLETVSGSGICWTICKSAPHPRQPCQHPTTQFFTGQMPFLPPNQQRQSTEGIMKPLQINIFITLYMLPFIPLHFLCTHFGQLVQVHCIELLPTPLPHTPHGHLTALCITFCDSHLIITLVLFIFTLMPLFSTKSFHSLSLLIRSSSL